MFGPTVQLVDAAYSFRIGPMRPPRGVSAVAYFDLGPSLGFVQPGDKEPMHHVLGGRASAAVDLQLWAFSVGGVFGYRGGLPLDHGADPWEGAFTASLRLEHRTG